MDPMLGTIILFAGNFAPRGWAFCNGQLLPISQNQALFSLLGTAYGGDGRTTFALPDLRGRVPMHSGDGPGLTPRALGTKLGAESVRLGVDQMPSHTHGLNASSGGPSEDVPAGQGLASGEFFSGTSPSIAMHPASVGSSGSGEAVSTVPPSQVLNFIISLAGSYPSRE